MLLQMMIYGISAYDEKLTKERQRKLGGGVGLMGGRGVRRSRSPTCEVERRACCKQE